MIFLHLNYASLDDDDVKSKKKKEKERKELELELESLQSFEETTLVKQIS